MRKERLPQIEEKERKCSSNSYKSYSKFNDIEDKTLAAWNRLVTFLVIFRDINKNCAKNYLREFSEEDRALISEVKQDIQSRGYNTVRSELVNV